MRSRVANLSLVDLRARRNPPQRALDVASVAKEFVASVVKHHKQVGGASEAWLQVVPLQLGRTCHLQSLSRGTLLVRVTDASARFALDRFLRGGGERALISASGGKIRRVRLI